MLVEHIALAPERFLMHEPFQRSNVGNQCMVVMPGAPEHITEESPEPGRIAIIKLAGLGLEKALNRVGFRLQQVNVTTIGRKSSAASERQTSLRQKSRFTEYPEQGMPLEKGLIDPFRITDAIFKLR